MTPPRTGDAPTPRPPDPKQVYLIDRENRADYARAAHFVGKLGADLLCIQHEYGIYGGDHGEYVVDLARAAEIPVVVTLHTILPQPSERQRQIIQDLNPHVARFVVMAHKGAELLQSAYGIPADKIHFIPHGAPDVFLETERATKAALGLPGRRVLSTFGLISPNKGIEDAIAALPAVVEQEPDTMYLVLGETHPAVKRREGEQYRESLQKQVADLGLDDHVRFVNKFLTVQELIDYLLATDIYITPYYANPQPDHVGDPGLRDGDGAGHRLHALSLRRGTAGRGARLSVPVPGHPGALRNAVAPAD